MATVQELIASTQLPEGSKKRLQKVMQKVGYGDNEEVDDTLRELHQVDLEKAGALGKLNPPLTLRETQALLLKTKKAGELVLTVRGPARKVAHPVASVL